MSTSPEAAGTNANDAALDGAGDTSGAKAAVVTCIACGNQNTPDSRFCRHCGAELTRAAVPSPNGATANGATANARPGDAPADAPARETMEDEELSSEEIDARRAQHLLDRASLLSEHGDMAGAILACRQATSLDPDSPAAFSMLGLMLERSGDVNDAIAAYEKVLALAPDSPLERDRLQRLRDMATSGGAAAAFHFDDSELFEDTAPVAGDAQAAPAVGAATAQPATADAVAPAMSTTMPAADAARPPAPGAIGTVGPAAPPVGAPVVAPPLVAPLSPLDLDLAPPDLSHRPLWWRALRDRPSFYLRSAPLFAVSALGLLFMLWARGAAVSRDVATRVSAPVIVQTEAAPDGAPNDTSGNSAATTGAPAPGNSPATSSPGAPANPAFPINNSQATAPASRYTPPAASSAAPAGGAPSGGAPRLPSPNLSRPRPTGDAPAAAASGGAGGNNPFAGIPPARIMTPPPGGGAAPIAPAAGGDSGAASSGGGPVGVGGSPRRGPIRVTGQPPTALPPPAQYPPRDAADNRPPSRPADRAPGNAGRSAASGLSGSGNIADAGYRAQRRALLYLEQGDYPRAIDEFRSAIASYNDQIARGVRVSEARKGIAACQSGMRLAQANLRR